MINSLADDPMLDLDDAERGVGRSVARGSLVGVVIAFVGIAVAMLLGGKGLGAAAGLGVFVAFWGGLGFGSMIGGVMGVIRLEEAEAAADAAASGDHPGSG